MITPFYVLSFILIVLLSTVICVNGESELFPDDLLSPYHQSRQRTRRSLRYIRDCQPVHFGNLTHEEYASSTTLPSGRPFVQIKNIFYEYDVGFSKKEVHGHVSVAENPLRTFSILEPVENGGCNKSLRATVAESSRQRKCYVASNAGYFRTKNGNCLGNIVSNGNLVIDADGIQNVNFGIRKDGSIVTGYLSEEMVLDQENPFVQLVTGVVWLVRNGQTYVDVSKKAECEDLEETGTVDQFVNVLSARTAIGHDAQGRVVIVHVDGRTSHRGMNLYTFAKLLLKYGLVNAINLDGGGSTTMVVNGTVVNYPSDGCGDFICAREVSTIACFHTPDCDPLDCNGRGTCQMGECVCDHPWTGPGCGTLECKLTNCSMNGVCTKDGCLCNTGWMGRDCSKACPGGTFGVNCTQKCLCYNGGSCDVVSGTCSCPPGWMGRLCQLSCPPGRHGASCLMSCDCNNTCYCDPVTGLCPSQDAPGSDHLLLNQTTQWQSCLDAFREDTTKASGYDFMAREAVKSEYRTLFTWFVGVISLCGASILANCILIYMQCDKSTKNKRRRYKTRKAEEEEFIFMLDEEL